MKNGRLPGKHSSGVSTYSERVNRKIHIICQQCQCIFQDHPAGNNQAWYEILHIHLALVLAELQYPEKLVDNISEAIKVRMIIAVIVNKARFIAILNNVRIGRIDNMTVITSGNAMIFKFVGSSGKSCGNYENKYLKAERDSDFDAD